MAREAASVTTERMLRVIRLVNDLAHANQDVDDLLGGTDSEGSAAVPLTLFARMLDLEPAKVIRIIDKINLGCGDSVPELYIDYDEQRQTIVPHAIGAALDRPLRLSAAEARALLAAIETSGIDEAPLLAQKIEGAFPPIDAERLAAIQNAAQRRELGGLLALILHAIERRTVLELSYQGLSDHAPRERRVEPGAVSYDAAEGMWYLHARCRDAGGWRCFKLSRIGWAKPCDETFEEPDADEVPHGLQTVDRAPAALLAIRDPHSLIDPLAWRGLTYVDADEARKLVGAEGAEPMARAIAAGAELATIPWIVDGTWLARMVAQTCGGVEVIHPLPLRKAVREYAEQLTERLDAR